MASYITRFRFAEGSPFPPQLVPMELTKGEARHTQTKLLAYWFTSGARDLVAVWDAVSELAVHAIVAEVTRYGGITAETGCMLSDDELAQRGLARQHRALG